ncbi:MAG: hypothetical protein K0S80_1011 [Neobacillus sp.]|jgi:transposase|nr:hypothetical protein [Neobacillus sp.]
MKAQIKALEKGIQNLITSLPISKRTIDTIPGIGLVFSAGIIADIGQIDRFPNEAKLAKYARLYWHKHQSGNFITVDTKLSRTENVYLRYNLIP